MAGVDVAIPCFEQGRFLRDCVESVLGQGIERLRVLIIDNASADDSVEVARRLAARNGNVELVVHDTNLGPHASFNEGVDWARAKYFMVLCADDLLAPKSLARMIAILEKHPEASFAYGTDVHWHDGYPAPARSVSDDPVCWRVRGGDAFILERCRSPERYIAAGMVLVRTRAHKAAGHYRDALPHTDDFEMLLRLACLGSVAETQAVVGIKRMHADNRTQGFLAERSRDLAERRAALESFFAREGAALPDAARLLDLGLRSIAERAYWCAVKDVAHGRLGAAVELFTLAFRLAPRFALLPPLSYLRRMERPLLEAVR